MLCPHCGHDNVDGRKYCHACAKPLAQETRSIESAIPRATAVASTPFPISASPSTPTVSGMAITSFALSFLAFILPLGIAAAVMGHMSRSQIARSNGRQTGTWLAFAGLVITYLEFAAMVLVGIAAFAAVHGLNQDLSRDRHSRAMLLQAIYAHHQRTNTDYARQRRDVVDALRLIHASEADYLGAHPEEGYACQIYQLGTVTPNELNLHIVNSHYEIKIDQCRGADEQHIDDRVFAAVAIPRSDSNPAEAPVYCVDQTGVVRRYRAAAVNDLHQAILFEHKSCPESGETVE